MTAARLHQRTYSQFGLPVMFILAGILVFLATWNGFTSHAQEEETAQTPTFQVVVREHELELKVLYEFPEHTKGNAIKVELLAPDNDVITTDMIPFEPGADHSVGLMTLGYKIKPADMVWYRLRYLILTQGKPASEAVPGIVMVSQVLRYPVVRLIGTRTFGAGSLARIRAVVADGLDGSPVTDGLVKFSLKQKDRKVDLGAAKLDEAGNASEPFRFPDSMVGQAILGIHVETRLGDQDFSELVSLVTPEKILLSTDKPLYQPGQTIHVRALALDRFSRQPAFDRPLLFEIKDAKGNKILKKSTKTNAFGVAFTDFQLAEELNQGSFQIQAILSSLADPFETISQTLTVKVQTYKLPRFKVTVELDKDENGKPKAWYKPGDTISGTITARYFFGKPVPQAPVSIRLNRYDTGIIPPPPPPPLDTPGSRTEIPRTDQDGKYRFSLKLEPVYGIGSDAIGGVPLGIEATVTDAARHSEKDFELTRVSTSPILILAVPESGSLVMGVENRISILTTYLDGTPVSAEVQAPGLAPATIKTDHNGFGVGVTQVTSYGMDLQLKAQDEKGNKGSATLHFPADKAGNQALLLRTDQTLYQSGDTVFCTLKTAGSAQTVFLDVIKEGQPVFSTAVSMQEGNGSTRIPLSKDLFGTLDIRAYSLQSSYLTETHRLIFVDPQDGLTVTATAAKPVFKPREEVEFDLSLTDAKGAPKPGIIGVDMVDEAVWALSESQPGYEKAFFYLEQKFLESNQVFSRLPYQDREPYKVISFDPAAPRAAAATLLFAAAANLNSYTLLKTYGETYIAELQRVAFSPTRQKFLLTFQLQSRMLQEKINRYLHDKHITKGPIEEYLEDMKTTGYLTAFDLTDPFGNPYTIQTRADDDESDADDIQVVLDGGYDEGGGHGLSIDLRRVWHIHQPIPPLQTSPEFTGKRLVSRDRRTPLTKAHIGGFVNNELGRALSWATVLLQPLNPAKPLWSQVKAFATDEDGIFEIEDVPAGTYYLGVIAPKYGGTTKLIEVRGDEQIRFEIMLRKADPDTVHPIQLSTTEQSKWDNQYGLYIDRKGIIKPCPRPEMFIPSGAVEGVLGGTGGGIGGGVGGGVPGGVPGGVVGGVLGGTGGGSPPVRSYFPETLYSNPAVITDALGHARITVKMADSITTWRVLLQGSTADGKIGSGLATAKVFQDFFIDIDAPLALTEGDTVALPVTVFNYLPKAQEIEIGLEQANWLSLVKDQPVKHLKLAANAVTTIFFRIRAEKVGKHPFTVTARLSKPVNLAGTESSVPSPLVGDAVSRTVEVVPNGKAETQVVNDILNSHSTSRVYLPAEAIPGASQMFLKCYPAPLSHLAEGLQGVLQMPYGCFEQTSSVTYPNVMVLEYLKTTHKLAPTLKTTAEGYISQGYQRLLTFEVNRQGFSLYGRSPANPMVTAYGLMQLTDMARVAEVEPAVIERTRKWLANQQNSDGGFSALPYFQYGSPFNGGPANLRSTAYIGWALAASGDTSGAAERAWKYLENKVSEKTDAYTLALVANFALEIKAKENPTARLVNLLVQKAKFGEATAFWEITDATPTYAHLGTATLETTALAALALVRWEKNPELAQKALRFLLANKDWRGTWYSTQATVLCLKALTTAAKAAGDAVGTVALRVNGVEAGKLDIKPENFDILQQIDLTKWIKHNGDNTVELSYDGTGGGFSYQIAARYYVPWKKPVSGQVDKPLLDLKVAYDKTSLKVDESVTASCQVQNNLSEPAQLVMLELAIPPGFEINREDFEAAFFVLYPAKSKVSKYTVKGDTVTIYLTELAAGEVFAFTYQLRAKYPIQTRTFPSRVYEYYAPSVGSYSQPADLVVTD
ncbi:MAG: hypothetical protein K1Y36_19360 [Blastocatellia bacterium]|nr:hypothetical protein [Blastocatellia bacterium]